MNENRATPAKPGMLKRPYAPPPKAETKWMCDGCIKDFKRSKLLRIQDVSNTQNIRAWNLCNKCFKRAFTRKVRSEKR